MLVVKKKKSTCKCKDIRDVGSVLSEEGPLEGEWQPTLVFLPGKSHGQRSLAGCHPWACNKVGHDLATKQNIHIYVWAHTQVCIMYYVCWPIHVWVHTRETRVWSLGQEDPLEKGMATHSSIPAWEILWAEERGGLQFMGLQRVGHDWAIVIKD